MGIADLYTLQDLATEALEAYGDTSALSLPKGYKAINRAIQMINRRGTWIFAQVQSQELSTVADQENYNVTKADRGIRTIHISTTAWRKLERVDQREFRKRIPNNTTTTGTPSMYRVIGFNKSTKSYRIALYPIPDAVYTLLVDGEKNISLLEDADDDIRTTSGIPEEMIPTVIALATAILYEKKDDPQYKTKLMESLALLEEDYYRLAADPDSENRSREYGAGYDIASSDPVSPPNVS